jgi:nitroreductase
MLAELVTKNRSYRRFDPHVPVERKTLVELVDLARLTASGGNYQPLKYILACDKATNDKVFPCLRWASYLKDWKGPSDAERPTAYIVVLQDKDVTANPSVDHGVAAQTILLGAAERWLGGCMIGSIDRGRLRKALEIPPRYEIELVLALGKPQEKVVLDVAEGGDIRYWRDASGVHHVPKRPLEEIILR